MIKSVNKNNNYHVVHQFESVSELFNYLKATPRRATADKASEKDDEYWTGSKDLQSAYDLLLGGDMNLYKEFIKGKDLKMEKQFSQFTPKRRTKYDIVGGFVDVPSYLVGVPTCMINRDKQLIKSKVLNLAINIGVSAGVSAEKMRALGTRYLQIIELLEKVGYRCNLYIASVSREGRERYICLTRIKTDKEPLNLKKCVFPMIHPSMFRRVMFNWFEKCELADTHSTDFTQYGYGCPIHDQEEVKQIIKSDLNKDYIVWGFQNCDYDKVGVDKILEELRNKYGITIGENN